MRFLELHLDGFGKLVDCALDFAPGLNLVFGPNEAGKSTLQHALLALLYGFYEDGSISRAKQESATALIPWLPGIEFAGSLLYQLDDGRTFRAARTFSGKMATRLMAMPGSRDISSEFRSASHGRLFFADKQFGMDKRVFESTCVVRQAELIALEESAQAITDTLMRLSSSASQDTTTADALALLDQALRDQIGTDRAWTKPLAQVRKHLEEMEAARQKASTTRREAFALTAELNEGQTRLDAFDAEIERLSYLATLAEARAIQAQLDAFAQADTEAKRLAGEVERWKSWTDFPVHLRDQVIRLDADRTRLTEVIAKYAAHITEVNRQRGVLADKLTAAEKTVAALADAKNVSAEQLPQVQKLVAKWESTQAAEQAAETRLRQAEERLAQAERAVAKEQAVIGGIVDVGPVGLAQLQQKWIADQRRLEQAQTMLQEAWAAWQRVGMSDEQLQALAEKMRQIEDGAYVEEHPRKGCRFWSRPNVAAAPPPEAAIYVQIKPIRDRWDAARVEAQTAKETLGATAEEVRQCLGLELGRPIDQGCFEVANQKLAVHGRLLSEVKVHQQAVTLASIDAQDACGETESARAKFSETMSSLGHAETDLEAAVQSYERQCKRKAQRDQAVTELQRLQGEDRALAQEEQAQARREEDLHAACESLRVILSQAGIIVDQEGLAGGVDRFEEEYRHHQQWLRAQERYQATLNQSAGGLTKQDREAARKRLARLQQQLDNWQVAHPEWVRLKADRDAHEYRERSQKLETERLAKQQRCTQLRESLQRMTMELSHPAGLAEEIAAAQAQLRRLEYLRDVITLAREELAAATQEYQRAFAPRLERLVAEGVARTTQGRYTQVGIDPGTLAVTLAALERNKPVEAALLSTGTRDLIYLLLRIGIARLMSSTGETLPLLLDDPLVQLDRNRRDQTLQLLTTLAEETQIVLFTKDDDILRWYQENLAGDERHRLLTLERVATAGT